MVPTDCESRDSDVRGLVQTVTVAPSQDKPVIRFAASDSADGGARHTDDSMVRPMTGSGAC
jgi:hypothetical protein